MLTRIISALIAIAILVLTMWLGSNSSLLILCSIASLLIATEYSNFFLRTKSWQQILFLFFCGLIFTCCILAQGEQLVFIFPLICLFFGLLVLFSKQNTETSTLLKQTQWSVLGFLYVAVFPGIITKMCFSYGPKPLIALMLISFIGDSFAYFSGRLFGKKKLAPHISPNKTIIGAIGGLAGSALIAPLIIHHFIWPSSPLSSLILIGLTTGLLSQLGDLFESLIKRVAGIKDSGRIMPGHGGLLDRVDGLLFATPMFYCLFIYFIL